MQNTKTDEPFLSMEGKSHYLFTKKVPGAGIPQWKQVFFFPRRGQVAQIPYPQRPGLPTQSGPK
jgi:hypothetical protein